MNFDWTAEGPKLLELLYGVLAFLAVVGVLLLVLDKLPLRKDRWVAAAFLFPAGALLMIGLIIPAIRTTILSFQGASTFEAKWVGLDNYKWIFTQREALITLRNTLLWVVLVPLIATSIGLIYAVLVDKARLESFAKALIFMPMAISFVGAGIIWKFVYAYRPPGEQQIGLLNQIVVWFGGEPRQWLLDSPWNTLFLIVVLIWIQAGFAMVVLSASIKAIPTEIVEAARLDGVTPWQMFWQVTIPSIRPALIVVLVTITVGTLKVFDIVRAMTSGNFDTSVLAYGMYDYAFVRYDSGKGAAFAVLLFVLVTPIIIYQIRNLRQQRTIR
ncbi:alpha-glucoside transport system permease protein [Allocatelliglobosispora scoriae]|uniref:Alpha-glucoside transport system permease protein n=1 Tax=Allocatelliglobosispora scoriae TaxID=643052 RepID=A0A841C212_9ACTN|nr:sugar ABC transporter permease [Allocatelliglobosispora scoriae]MBB5873010.1 alpha-glucoside transport system permease protein [Allocatelliglobosispora scoriae]